MHVSISVAKRKRILDAALDVFSTKGFHSATISEVASRAHVGKGTVYLYFSGKEALLVSIFGEIADRIVGAFDSLTLDSASLHHIMRSIVSEELKEGESKAQVLRLLAQQPFLTTVSLRKKKQILIERLVGKLAQRICVAVEDGSLRPCNPMLVACVLLSFPAAVSLYVAANPAANTHEMLPHVSDELAEMLQIGLGRGNQ